MTAFYGYRSVSSLISRRIKCIYLSCTVSKLTAVDTEHCMLRYHVAGFNFYVQKSSEYSLWVSNQSPYPTKKSPISLDIGHKRIQKKHATYILHVWAHPWKASKRSRPFSLLELPDLKTRAMKVQQKMNSASCFYDLC